MSDARNHGAKIAIIGLATAVVGLAGAAFTAFNDAADSRKAVTEVRQESADQKDKIEELRGELVVLQEARRKELEEDSRAAQKATACQSGTEAEGQVEARFSSLMTDHGILVNMMKACASGSRDNRGQCLTLLCGGAYWFTGGESNCATVGSDLALIVDEHRRTMTALSANSCAVPATRIGQFLQ